MNKRSKTVVTTLGVIALLLISAGAITQIARANAVERSKDVIGAWYLDANSVHIGYFPALIEFNSDGAAVGSSKPIGTESPAYGNWISNSPKQIALTMQALTTDTSRNFVGSLKFISTLDYNASNGTWSGPYSLDIFDTAGNVLARDSGTFHMSRIAVVSTLP